AHLLLLAENQARSGRPGGGAVLAAMRAAYVVEAERWTDTAITGSLARDAAVTDQHSSETFAGGLAALRTGQRGRAQAALTVLDGGVSTSHDSTKSPDPHTQV